MEENKSPKLRFPEFSKTWKSKKLKDLLKLTSRSIKMKDEEKYTLVTVKRRHAGVEERGLYYGKDILVKNQYELKQHDFIISKRQIVHDACGIVPKYLDGAIVSNEYSVFIPKENLNIHFFDYFTHRPKISHSFYLSSIGVHIEKMLFKVDDWLKREYYFPSLAEQQKIADFLSSVDQKIQQLGQKKELLEEYKKGVMQKLFPSADGRAPEIRLKDENVEDFPNWEEYNVGNIFNLFVTNSFSRNDLTYESGEVKNIHYGDVHSEFKMGFKVNEETVPYIVEEKKLSKYDEEQYVKPGDLIVADASEDYADIGKAIEVIETGDEKILAGLHTIHARDKKPLTVVGFKGYLFRSESVRKQLKRISQGASVLGISKGNFKEINVKLPCLAEQRKIVEFLQNIDKNITLVESKIENFQIFKKGLLQQMFV